MYKITADPGASMQLINDQVFPNCDEIPNSNVSYALYWDSIFNRFHCFKHDNEPRWVSYDECPYELVYSIDKPLEKFTEDEKKSILEYRGLTLEDGFELGDVWMEGSYIKLLQTYMK